MRQEFRFVRGHIDLYRTIVLAPLAREAQIQRFANRLGPPPALHHLTADHLIEHACPAARRVLLFARDHEARAHNGLFAVDTAAHARTDAAVARACEAVMIVG